MHGTDFFCFFIDNRVCSLISVIELPCSCSNTNPNLKPFDRSLVKSSFKNIQSRNLAFSGVLFFLGGSIY